MTLKNKFVTGLKDIYKELFLTLSLRCGRQAPLVTEKYRLTHQFANRIINQLEQSKSKNARKIAELMKNNLNY